MKNTVKVAVLSLCALFCLSAAAFSQEQVLDIYSPALLGSGTNAASTASPFADVLNPAASGGSQRLTVDLNYIGLPGLGASVGWGHAVNAGATFPTPVGVFTGSARFLSSAFPSLNIGSLGAFNVSFAKDIFPNLYVGAGIGFQIGSDWGLGLDLGLIHVPGDVGFLKDVTWGFALRGIGKGFMPLSTPTGLPVLSMPPAFTPDLGASFAVLKTDAVTLSFAPDLSFPTFQDVRFGISGGLLLFSMVRLDVSYAFDLQDTLHAAVTRPFPVSFGLSVNLKMNPKGSLAILDKSDLAIATSVAPLADGVFGFGLGANMAVGEIDRTPPVVTLGTTDTVYISPNTVSSQGIFTLPLTITDGRYIKGYRLVVKDSRDKVVRTIEESDKGPASKGIANLWDRLLTVKKSIPVPQSMSWDGKNDEGAQVPDGTYTYTVESWDDNGNLARTAPLSVVVDTVAPSVKVSTPYLEFSPSGEGTKGSLPIAQEGSTEDLWVGTIYDEKGTEVRQFRWTGDSPKSFQWGGKDSSGKLAADGTYTYKVTSTDRAGNTGAATLAGIVINTQATPVSLSTDMPAFSPNGDGIKDTIKILPVLKVTAGIDKWTLVVKDQAGTVKRTFSGESTIPAEIEFDGNDEVGTRLPEGSYRASLNIVYHNGHTPTADTQPFLLRVTAPSATVSAVYKEFSPDGVGTKTALPMKQSGSVEILWQGEIRNAADKGVRVYRWDESAPRDFQWDGRDDTGKLAPDGTYSYEVTSTDPAGNTGSASLDGIVVNTTPTPVSLSVDLAAFSPNGDGVKDTLHLIPTAPVGRGIEKWSLLIKDQAGKARRSFTGDARLPSSLEFDGKDDAGTLLPEGSYAATLAVQYANGHNPADNSPAFVIDVTPPVATTRSDYTVFSPIGQGARNLLTFTQSGTKDADWSGTVEDSAGKAVRTMSWKGRPDAKFVFDGHGDDGGLLPDGAYTYTLAAMDRAGNSTRSAPIGFEIDTRATPVIVSTDLTWFSPNGDGVKDSVRIIPKLKVTTDVETFELRIRNAQGKMIRSFKGANAAPAETVWDGRDESGGKSPDGQYVAELDLLYRNGNHPVARTNPFFIETVYPAITVAADYTLFCPAPGSARASLQIKQSSSDEDLWAGDIQGADGKSVRSYSWKGKAVDFSWDGRDDNGNSVSDGVYSYIVSATDKAGNTTKKTLGGITVDTRPTPVSVSARADGFSPNGDGFRDTMEFNLSAGLPEGISSWKLAMVDGAGTVQKTFTGEEALPETLSWDGKGDRKAAPNGTYYAELDVEYTKGNRPNSRSAEFLLSVAPPKLTLDAGPEPFSPDGDGYNDTLTLNLGAEDASPIDSWDITVMDPANHFFINWSGKGAPAEPLTWDGLSANGELVESAQDYTIVATAKDELGNAARLTRKLPVDVLVVREGDKLKVRVSSITFKENTADYINVPEERSQTNQRVIKRLAEVFKKYNQYKIQIEGHAVMVYWDNPALGKKEQQEQLLPLSKARADSIKTALTKLGIDAGRITTIGYGGEFPIVPFSDLENRWKDRRVEFILVR